MSLSSLIITLCKLRLPQPPWPSHLYFLFGLLQFSDIFLPPTPLLYSLPSLPGAKFSFRNVSQVMSSSTHQTILWFPISVGIKAIVLAKTVLSHPIPSRFCFQSCLPHPSHSSVSEKTKPTSASGALFLLFLFYRSPPR